MLKILQQEIVNLIEMMGNTSFDESGGVTRLLYTDEWLKSQHELKKIMNNNGMNTYFDEVGNLYGRINGTKFTDETILTGSHVDTVKNGGKYDGMYGIVAGIIALSYLKETYGEPLRNIEVVSFAEEEGSRFPYTFWGSKNLLNIAKKDHIENLVDSDGISFIDAMERCGFKFKDKETRKDIKYFIEAHVEQGNILEHEKKEIGIVKNIVGQRRYMVELKGMPNHAGTTALNYRKDTLYAASKMIAYIGDSARKYGDPLVATTGFIETNPNMSNSIAGYTCFSIDIRHTDKDFLENFSERCIEEMYLISKQCSVEIKIDMWMDELPVPMDNNLLKCLENVCKEINLSYKVMNSGAGHDSQLIGAYIPTTMIFVPSKGGISHNPNEFTAPEYLEKGVLTLINVLYKLAYI